ncbi:putative acetyl-CoA acetyltransferase, cytosolic 2 [Porphyridium purpureum]|uniref:Putative acetyl-CoA acetyltransferase, cytosolic 2 n=1 Tax=Porphyridium purpureum TaxID=35688 RepID=A0A5J4Z2X6_PORPP|nr:putative acetyl-CoA acetyltransferase, cytosolic 2 [Porphyridium purpureum]|eukprot:POR3982..scf295_1
MALNDVYVVGYKRTPFGCMLGQCSAYTAVELGAFAMAGALEHASIEANEVHEVFMGNVCSAGTGQNPARTAAHLAGMPHAISTTVNKVCASGMKAVELAACRIQLGMCDVAVAGGMESMSNVPHYTSLRTATKFGDSTMRDGLMQDGLMDFDSELPMGNFAERCAQMHSISRDQMDEYTMLTYSKALAAQSCLQLEICSMTSDTVLSRVGKAREQILRRAADKRPALMRDEQLDKFDSEKIRKLKPVFVQESQGPGTITAANASALSDGAAALVLVSAAALKRLNLKALARLRASADAQLAPEDFTLAPAVAFRTCLQRANLESVDLVEINEAFAVVALANMKLLDLDPSRVNLHGGAVALGHPLGASGARILISLMSVLRIHSKRVGCAAICNGGGGASAMILELLAEK